MGVTIEMETISRKINLWDFGVASGIPKDFVCDDSALTEVIPYAEINGERVIRWRTFTHYYNWLLEFISDSGYYTPKNRGNDKLFLANVRPEGAEMEEVIELFRSAKWLYGDTYSFTTSENYTIENCLSVVCINEAEPEFIEMFGTLENAVAFLDFCETASGTSEPFIDIPIYFCETIKDLGIFTVCEEYWTKGKEYYSGDTVYFSGVDGIMHIYVAMVRKTNINSFVEGEWQVLPEFVDKETEGDEQYARSQLSTLLREKRSYIDGSDEPLPFCIVNGRAELPFVKGSGKNIYKDGEILKYNTLEHIRYYEDEYTENPAIMDVNYYANGVPESGVIEFEYTVGNLLKGSDASKGITYVERFPYEVSAMTVGEDETYEYIDIKYDLPFIDFGGTSEDDDTRYATIILEANGERVLNNNNLIKEEALIGMQDAKLDYSSLYIDRGSAASYEAFNVLGEMNTLEEVEKYRDDWFRIKGKRD